MIREFRNFVNRGNLVDIAVAFVMGVAFAAVITSLTEDLINPIVGMIFRVESLAAWAPGGIGLGAFLVAVSNFLIVALVMFLVVRAYNRMRDQAPPAPPAEEVLLLRQILDTVRSKG